MIRVYPVLPISAPRQVRKDIYNPSPHVLRYRAYRDELRIRHVFIPEPFHHVIFVLPMPDGWSEKKKKAQEGQPHQQRPDKDNLEKALLDAVYGEDSHVWDGRATKLWGRQGLVIISPTPVPVVLPFNLAPYYMAVAPHQGPGAAMSAVALTDPV